MPAATAKLCCRCNKDVSNTKRVKDTNGQYYCEPCYATAMKGAPQGGAIGTTAAAKTAAVAKAAPKDEYDIAEPVTPKRPVQKPVVQAPVAKAPPPPPATPTGGPATIPARCPACDAPTLPGRRVCIKCNRDLTKMDKLIAMKADWGKQSKEEKIGVWISRAVKGIVVLVVIGLAFMGYGLVHMLMHPKGVFDDYPTARAEAPKELLAAVNENTDKSWERAFQLISFHVRSTNNDNELSLYKMVYGNMRKDFISRYGPNWFSKLKVECAEPGNNEQVVAYYLIIDQDVYHAYVEAQVPLMNAIENMSRTREVAQFPENGKNHFGIMLIREYNPHPALDEPKYEPSKLSQIRSLQRENAPNANGDAPANQDGNAPANGDGNAPAAPANLDNAPAQ